MNSRSRETMVHLCLQMGSHTDVDSQALDNPLRPWRNLAMTDALDGVRDHYRATGLTERLKIALTVLGPEDQPLIPQQLGALDQFHTRGLAATAELAKLTGITADMSVLDVV